MRFLRFMGASLPLAAVWISPAAAHGEGPAPVCYSACQSTLARITFDDMLWNYTGLNRTCHSQRYLTSLYLCLGVYCMPEARDVGLGPLNQSCQAKAFTPIPPFDIISNYTEGDIDSLRKIDLNDTKQSHVFREVVLPSKSLFGAWWDTLDSVDYTYARHYYYGLAMTIFWVVVVAIGIANHIIISVTHSQVFRSPSFKPWTKATTTYSWLVNRISVPATFGNRCAQQIGFGTVPPRIQSLTIMAFILMNVFFTIYGYKIVPVNLYFDSPFRQILRYGSDRTGIISFANFPLIWLFGMRNNILMWLTGWDFGTYNNFHRWVARVATIHAILHSVGYTVLILREGGLEYFAYWWTQMFWCAGVAATIGMSLLLGLSIYWLRRQQYELFLIIHIVMSIIILLTMLLHVSIFEGQYDPLFWIPFFIWIADRVLRVSRVLGFNPYFWSTWGSATYNPVSNIIRVSVPWGTSIYKPAAGTFYYLHVLNGKRCWESHPFTVATVLDEGQTGAKLLGEQVPLLESGEAETNTNSADNEGMDADPSSMTFLIRPYDGFTSRLRDMAAKAWPQKAPLQILVDGPYGHTLPFHTFDNVVFIVGGSGIVVPLSYLSLLTGNGKATPKSVQIHWAVREPAFALDVLRSDIGDALGSPNLSIEIHMTSSHLAQDVNDWPSQVVLQHGRIDAPSVIASVREQAGGDETVAVVACGPAQMADAARKKVAGMLSSGDRRIEYFEESFQW